MESEKKRHAIDDISRLYEQCVEAGDSVLRGLGEVGGFKGIFFKDGYNLDEVIVWRRYMYEGFEALKRSIR